MRVRKRSILRAGFTCFMSILLLSSCSPGEHPFLMVQICVANDSGVDLFKRTLQSVARDERMRYVDRSKASERELKALGALNFPDGKFVNVGVLGNMGPSLGAGNLGLNTYDIAVGFARGPDTEAAIEFSERVIARLEQHWTLKAVPNGSGAFPNPECTRGIGAPPNNSFKPNLLRKSA